MEKMYASLKTLIICKSTGHVSLKRILKVLTSSHYTGIRLKCSADRTKAFRRFSMCRPQFIPNDISSYATEPNAMKPHRNGTWMAPITCTKYTLQSNFP